MNKLNIDEKVRVIMPGVVGDGETGSVCIINKWPDGTIVYNVLLDNGFDSPIKQEGKCLPINSIQVKDGQYEKIKASESTARVRCKFTCVEKDVQPDGAACIRMIPVTFGSAENEQFFKYTPTGNFAFGTVNSEAAKQIEQGEEYYIDIINTENDAACERPIKPLTLKQSFEKACNERVGDPKYLIVAVQLPTGAVEIITNTENTGDKAKYYSTAYDECFCLKTNPAVKVIDFMLV